MIYKKGERGKKEPIFFNNNILYIENEKEYKPTKIIQ